MVEPLRRELPAVGLAHAVDSFAVAPSWEAKGPRRTRRDHAERGVMQGHQDSILIDAYRISTATAVRCFSWFLKRKKLRIGRRFDHVFYSPQVTVLACEYLHHLRGEGPSDHSALELDFDI
jgi:exonuclease III